MSGTSIVPIGVPFSTISGLPEDQRELLKKLKLLFLSHRTHRQTFTLNRVLDAAEQVVVRYVEAKGFSDWKFRDSAPRLLRMGAVLRHIFTATSEREFVSRFVHGWKW